jgi:hypothetical protein
LQCLRHIILKKLTSCNEVAPTFKEFWRLYNVREAVGNIHRVWDKVKFKTMNWVRRKVWEDCVQSFRGFEEPVEAIQENIVQLAKQIGLDELDSGDIQELMNSQGE